MSAGPSVPAERYFSAREIERARAYHRPLYRSYALSTAIGVAYLAILAFTPAGRWLAAPVDDLPKWAFAASYAASIVVVGAILRLPLSVWRGFVHEQGGGSPPRRCAGSCSTGPRALRCPWR